MTARTKRQSVIERPLPVILPPATGPAVIEVRECPPGRFFFTYPASTRGTYRLCSDGFGRAVMVRLDPAEAGQAA